MTFPTGVAADDSGNVFLAAGNDCIRKVNKAGIINTIAGNGNFGFSGDGGQATAAELAGPPGIAVDTAGNLYIADEGNNRVRKVNAAGVISTIAGNGIIGSSGNGGKATAAELYEPTGVALDKYHNIYIADWHNNCIRKVNDSGIITTVAGNDSVGFSGDGGPSTSAEFNAPYAIAIDTTGNLYIADVVNNRIREVTTPWIEAVQELKDNNGLPIAIGIGIYPNPSNGLFQLGISNDQLGPDSYRDKGTVEVFNMLGQNVYSQKFSILNSPFSIDLSAQPEGIYLLKLQLENGSVVTKKIEII
jgi:hypothetical protein